MVSRSPIGQWLKRACLVFVVCLAFQARAKADPINMTLTGIKFPNETGYVSNEYVYTSPLFFNSPTLGNFTAFCVDIAHDIGIGSNYNSTPEATPSLSGSFVLNGNTVSGLVAQEVAFIANVGLSTTDADMAAGAQLAIWQLLFPNSNPSAVSPGAQTDFQNFVTNAPTYLLQAGTWLDTGPTGPGQSMIFFPGPKAPEPASIVIMGLFAVPFCVGGIRRRFGRSRQA